MYIMILSLFHFSCFYAESPFLLRISKCFTPLLLSTEAAQSATKAGQAQLWLLVSEANCFFHSAVYTVYSVTTPGRNDLLNCCWMWSHWGLDNQQPSDTYHCNHRRTPLRASIITSQDASSFKASGNACLSLASGTLLYLRSHKYVCILCTTGPTYLFSEWLLEYQTQTRGFVGFHGCHFLKN